MRHVGVMSELNLLSCQHRDLDISLNKACCAFSRHEIQFCVKRDRIRSFTRKFFEPFDR